MNVQWYPGHMTKAKRQMQEDIKLIDLIIELVDSRVPLASRNPDIDELGRNKARLILLNKSDLGDERQNEAWKAYFQAKGFYVVKVDSRSGAGMKAIQAAIQEACKEKTERDRRRGIKNRPIRAMVVGIPNVGKSTFINTFAGRACAKTGNKPGVTKGKQWIRLNKNVELLDTPGILWPKFEDEEVGMRLAYIGSIKDDILNLEELSLTLIDFLREKYAGALEKRYQIAEEGTAVQVLEAIARSRGCLKKGEELDYAKASLILFDDFRSGKIGRITLEVGAPRGKITCRKLEKSRQSFRHCSRKSTMPFLKNTRMIPETVCRKLLEQLHKKEAAYQKELARTEAMKVYEHKYEDLGYICGIDEVGRGPLAGPVVAGAVILPKDCKILYLNDSKQLSAKKREELYDVIMENAVAVGIGMASPQRIDEINILQATYEAMREAISKLDPVPQILLNDAVTIPQVTIPQVPIIKGDAKSVSIAAASIVAKVTRDRMMVEYDKTMPEYGFASNKGYGAAAHIEALKKYGPSPIHRATFIKNFV